MSVSELRLRVTAESAVIVVVLAVVAATLGGARVGLGVLAGGALAIASFWRLAGDAASVSLATAASGRWLIALLIDRLQDLDGLQERFHGLVIERLVQGEGVEDLSLDVARVFGGEPLHRLFVVPC